MLEDTAAAAVRARRAPSIERNTAIRKSASAEFASPEFVRRPSAMRGLSRGALRGNSQQGEHQYEDQNCEAERAQNASMPQKSIASFRV